VIDHTICRPIQPEFLMDILPIFCDIDDFCRRFEPIWHTRLLPTPGQKRHRASTLALSEIMTILVLFHASGYRTFKWFYVRHVSLQLRADFPRLVSYQRFVELTQAALVPLGAYLETRLGPVTGIQFIDSLPVKVCHNRRIHNHKVFRGAAQRGKSSVDWFYGFKLHLVVNDRGELLAVRLTSGNTDDRAPVPELAAGLWGKLYGDRGYLGQALFEQLFAEGLQLVTKLKRNMKNRLMPLVDKLLLRKRALIESIHDQLKNIAQVEHTRHRSMANGFVNMLAALVAYTFQPKKPALNLHGTDLSEDAVQLLAAGAF
jgi:Transposase DDE domain